MPKQPRSSEPLSHATRKPARRSSKIEAVPRYRAIAGLLIKAISEGRYPVGSTLPPEHKLCEQFAISRFTVREAMRQLSEAGLITRKPRAGTVVIATQRRTPYAQTLGSLDDLLQYASDTELRLIYTGTIEVDQMLTREFPMVLGERWVFGLGIRYRKEDDLPVALTRIYINPLFSSITRRLKDREDPIYRLIEKHHGVMVRRVEQRILAVSLSRDDALHLKTKAHGPALRTLRLYYDKNDRLLEVSDSIHPGDRFTYTMTIRQLAR